MTCRACVPATPGGWPPSSPAPEAADDAGIETCFVCTDCGIWTYAYGLEVCALPPRCGVCTWLHEWVAPADRHAFRERAGLS